MGTQQTETQGARKPAGKPALMPVRARGKVSLGATLSLVALALLGCGDSLPKLQDSNPFAEKEVPLPGKRVAIIQQETLRSDAVAAGRPVVAAAAAGQRGVEPARAACPATRPAIWRWAAH